MFAETSDLAIDKVIDGALKDGGATASIGGYTIPDTGYMVGGIVDSLVLSKENLTGYSRAYLWQIILRYVHRNFKLLADAGYFLGSWVDQSNGELYIDVSKHFSARHEALSFAEEKGEIAIWDIEYSEDVPVNPDMRED